MERLRFALVWLPLLLPCATACTPAPRSELLVRVAEARSAPAAREAETWAPQASAHAKELEQQAQSAQAAGDGATADVLAEQALAANEHAWILTRVARAERRRLSAEAELTEQQRALGELQAQDQHLSAEAAQLELRAQVVKDALPLGIHEAAGPERQEARRKAAAALSTQGRLLCVAARLLGESVAVKAPLAQLDELDQQLEAGKAPRALETASELRSQCQRVISGLRRERSAAPTQSPVGAASASPPHQDQAAPRDRSAPIPADQLLTELSAAGREPSRDERGVSVVLRDVFEADGSLSQTGRAELEELGRIAKEHPDFPVLLVGHTAAADSRAAMDQKLGTLAQQLAALGITHLDSQDAGARQPLLPPELPHARQRNQRVELVFVAPGL